MFKQQHNFLQSYSVGLTTAWNKTRSESPNLCKWKDQKTNKQINKHKKGVLGIKLPSAPQYFSQLWGVLAGFSSFRTDSLTYPKTFFFHFELMKAFPVWLPVPNCKKPWLFTAFQTWAASQSALHCMSSSLGNHPWRPPLLEDVHLLFKSSSFPWKSVSPDNFFC